MDLGKPKVPYKETITKSVEAEGRFIRQSGGRGQYGHVLIEIEPLEMGKGFEFENKIEYVGLFDTLKENAKELIPLFPYLKPKKNYKK